MENALSDSFWWKSWGCLPWKWIYEAAIFGGEPLGVVCMNESNMIPTPSWNLRSCLQRFQYLPSYHQLLVLAWGKLVLLLKKHMANRPLPPPIQKKMIVSNAFPKVPNIFIRTSNSRNFTAVGPLQVPNSCLLFAVLHQDSLWWSLTKSQSWFEDREGLAL